LDNRAVSPHASTYTSLIRLLSFLGCLVVAAAAPGVASAMEDVDQARNLLKKMAVANRERDYQGVFTYEHAGVLKSIRILHVVHDGLEFEHLLYLNGPHKEIIRRGIPPHCKRKGDRFLSGVPMPSRHASHLENHYELLLRGEDRVAGRAVKIIQVMPKDDLRYGYVLSVDKQSGLLLQSLLIGTNRRVMERFQYIDLSLEPDQDAVDELLGGPQTVASDCAPGTTPAPTSWQAAWLPPGFEAVESSEDEEGNVVMSFSDGLSFVSVFVDSGGVIRFPDIQAQRGATVAQHANVIHDQKEFAICVVGEVPPETAAKMAQFVQPQVRR